MLRYTIIIGAVVALSTGPILAQAKAPAAEKPSAKKAAEEAPAKQAADKAPKNDAAKTDKLNVTVVSVSGIAEQRSATEEKAKWTAIKAGDTLTEMTLVRTGLGGKVVLEFSNRGNVTIKSGSKIGIASFRKQGKLVQTRLGLKYGAIRAKVDSSQGANDFRVRTAVGTLAATGTGGEMAQWGDFSFQAKGTDGSWQATMANRVTSLIAGAWTNQDLPPAVAQLLAQQGTNVGDPHGGLTVPEIENLLVNGGGRGIVGFVGNPQTGSGGSPQLILPVTTNDPVATNLPQVTGPVSGGGPIGGGDPEHRHPR